MNVKDRLAQYAPVRLKADLDHLTDSERRILPLLFDAAVAMDDAFWIQNYGDRDALLASTPDPDLRRLIYLNYGPWDRLRGNEPFIDGAGTRPPGANFYPPDLTKEEFEASERDRPALKSPFTMVRRDRKGDLVATPYHRFFRKPVERAAYHLRQAAEVTEEAALKTFLRLRADALLTDDYLRSDLAWMDIKSTNLLILIGPMEIADRAFGLKTAYAATILVKDSDYSGKFEHLTSLLQRFQENLPVPGTYKEERPGVDGDFGVYDVLFYAGYDRASPPLGVAWPSNEKVQARKGTRSLLLQNAMTAHFELILAPLADLLIADDQRMYVTAEANFNMIMLHELAHGLGIKHTLTSKVPVREALRDQDYAVEENKADLLSLAMLDQLSRWGIITEADRRDGYVTALARLLYNCDGERSIARLNFFKEAGAISHDAGTGKYRIHVERMATVASELAEKMLCIQGDGDYDEAKIFTDQYGRPDQPLQRAMKRLDDEGVPLAIAIEPV